MVTSRSAGATCARVPARGTGYSSGKSGAGEEARTGDTLVCHAARRGGSSFRGDASAGPNPGGGFYGAPNINIGRIREGQPHRDKRGRPGSMLSKDILF